MKTTKTQETISKNQSRAAAHAPRLFTLRGLRYPACMGGGFFRFFAKRTRVRFCVSCIALSIPAVVSAAEMAAESTPTVTFDGALTSALIAVLTAVATWLGTRSREASKAEGRIKVALERQPPLAEEVARVYATKKELGIVESRIGADVAALRSQISENNTTLRDHLSENNTKLRETITDLDKRDESRARGTHARIDQLQTMMAGINKTLGRVAGNIEALPCMRGAGCAAGKQKDGDGND